MKKILKVIIILVVLMANTNITYANDELPGYSSWSTEESGNEYEVSGTQYGRKVPSKWSSWQEDIPDSVYQKSREGIKKIFYNNGKGKIYGSATKRKLCTWNFNTPTNITYFYGDVDTYYLSSDNKTSNYEAPPLQLYCDGSLIAERGAHDVLKNWSPDINVTCKTMYLYMLDNSANGARNRASIVGTWVGYDTKEYAYVTEWNNGQDWRFNKEYEHITGANPQIPTSRVVYSYPLTYSITYVLDEGTPNGELPTSYTVLDEVDLPSVRKKAHDFIGFYDSNGRKYEKINKGTYGNLILYAKYEKRVPKLDIGYTYFEVDIDNPKIEIQDILDKTNAKATDPKQGDLSENIKITSIVYRDKEKTINNPDYLEVDSKDMVTITFYVENDVGGETLVNRRFYIIGKGSEIENYSDSIEIYSRYISKDYLYTLDDNSIWNTSSYKEVLNNIYN